MEKKEEWKDIEGYEGLYQVSNLGDIKSLRRNINLKPSPNKYVKNVYLNYQIRGNGI